MGLFDNLKSVFNKVGGKNTSGNSGFLGLQAPTKFDLSSNYNQNVNNTGSYNLPLSNNIGGTNNNKALGDYSFTKEVSDFIPDTDFAKKVTNMSSQVPDMKGKLSEALTSLGSSNDIGMSVPNIDVNGFKYQNGQINPAQQLETRNLYSYILR